MVKVLLEQTGCASHCVASNGVKIINDESGVFVTKWLAVVVGWHISILLYDITFMMASGLGIEI